MVMSMYECRVDMSVCELVKFEATEGTFIHIYAFITVRASGVTALEINVEFFLVADSAFSDIIQSCE